MDRERDGKRLGSEDQGFHFNHSGLSQTHSRVDLSTKLPGTGSKLMGGDLRGLVEKGYRSETHLPLRQLVGWIEHYVDGLYPFEALRLKCVPGNGQKLLFKVVIHIIGLSS